MRHANCARREATTWWDARGVDQTFRKTPVAPSRAGSRLRTLSVNLIDGYYSVFLICAGVASDSRGQRDALAVALFHCDNGSLRRSLARNDALFARTEVRGPLDEQSRIVSAFIQDTNLGLTYSFGQERTVGAMHSLYR
jgi:hypothetical protein